jgi:hypothetical protein
VQFHRPSEADENILIFVGLGQADENVTIVSSTLASPTKIVL